MPKFDEMNWPITVVHAVYCQKDEYGRFESWVGIYTNIIEAEKAAKNKGWYGGDAEIVERRAIIDDEDNVYLLDAHLDIPAKVNVNVIEAHKKAVESVMAKLNSAFTQEEIDLLAKEL